MMKMAFHSRVALRSSSVGLGLAGDARPRPRVRSVDRVARLDRVGAGVAVAVVNMPRKEAPQRAQVRLDPVRLQKPDGADLPSS